MSGLRVLAAPEEGAPVAIVIVPPAAPGRSGSLDHLQKLPMPTSIYIDAKP
jgi:hypothetical protein